MKNFISENAYENFFVESSIPKNPVLALFSPELWHKLGLQPKPKKTREQILKDHTYPGYINMINSCKKLDDLNYIADDTAVAKSEFKKIKERIEKCEKLGDCEETKRYYKGIKKLYLDKGITSKDVQLTLDYLNTEVKDAIKAKRKELKESK